MNAPPAPAPSSVVVPIIEERLETGTRIVEHGRVRLTRRVVEREVVVDEPGWTETVSVERRPVGRWVDPAAPPQARHDGDRLIVPVLEEVVVVERRLRLVEEVHVRTTREPVSSPRRVALRRWEVDVERRVLRDDLRSDPPDASASVQSPHVSRSFTMAHTLIACFDSDDHARHARDRLVAEGADAGSIHLRRESAATDATSSASDASGSYDTDSGGLSSWFRSIFGMRDEHDEVRTHREAMRRGGTLLTLETADETRIDRYSELLRDSGAVDLETRAAQWRSEGWDGGTAATGTITATAASATTDDAATRTVPVIEEELAIGTRVVQRGGVRVFTRLVETPVEEQVRLREEHAEVRRRPVGRPATEADLAAAASSGTIEVRETAEEPVVAKRAQVTEEVEVGTRATERTETIRDTVRHTEVEVDRIAATERDHAMARERGDTSTGSTSSSPGSGTGGGPRRS